MKNKTADEILAEKRRKEKKNQLEEWREFWRNAGPIRFAQEYLFCYPQVPPYPDWKNLQIESYCEGCQKTHKKFHDNGIPIHVILSEDQIELLNDTWLNGVRCIIISAGRGSGKTFILAIWNTWRLCTEDYYEITSMGGSIGQSRLLQKYIDFWRVKHPEVRQIINVSRKGIGDRSCETRMGSTDSFVACSETAVRGPHVNEVQADEACAAEAKGIEGQKAIEAIDWEITGRRDTYVWLTSTSHFLLGRFYEIYRTPEKFGFKRYIWEIAKHISGKPAHLMYQDRSPKNWKSAVWWITQDDIEKLRKRKSNEEWLCEALGRASLASGAIFKSDDLDVIICNLCEADDCTPYKWGKCKLIQEHKLGEQSDPIKNIKDRKSSFDYGDPAPCAFIIGGTKDRFIFILFAEEQKGLSTPELIDWIERELQRYKVFTINIPDSIAGIHVREIMENKGFSISLLEEQYKEERVQNLRAIVEKRAIIIPPAFWHLTESLRGMHRDKLGRIVKFNDHSFDALCYLCIEWGEMEGSISDLFDVLKEEYGIDIPEPEDEDEEEENKVEIDEEIWFKKGIKFWED